mmetsp:Transcript_18078/g.30176  ORF Transcript_18078/g.30176 Transcript_18078/m.30176 type:complete len:254 (+) Transcript_18078:77-838(+)
MYYVNIILSACIMLYYVLPNVLCSSRACDIILLQCIMFGTTVRAQEVRAQALHAASRAYFGSLRLRKPRLFAPSSSAVEYPTKGKVFEVTRFFAGGRSAEEDPAAAEGALVSPSWTPFPLLFFGFVPSSPFAPLFLFDFGPSSWIAPKTVAQSWLAASSLFPASKRVLALSFASSSRFAFESARLRADSSRFAALSAAFWAAASSLAAFSSATFCAFASLASFAAFRFSSASACFLSKKAFFFISSSVNSRTF